MKRHPDFRQWSTDVDLDWLAFCYVAGELPVGEAQAFERRLAVDPAACESLSAAVELAQLSALALDPAGTYALAAESIPDAGSITAAGGRLGECAKRGQRGRWWRYAAWLSCGALAGIGLTLALVGARGEFAGWGGMQGAPSVSTGTNGRGSAARVHVQQLAMAWAQGRTAEHSGSESPLALAAPGLELPDGGLLHPEPLAAEQPAPVSEWTGDWRVSPYDESWAEWNAGSAGGWPAGDDDLSLEVPSWMVTAVSHQEQQDGP